MIRIGKRTMTTTTTTGDPYTDHIHHYTLRFHRDRGWWWRSSFVCGPSLTHETACSIFDDKLTIHKRFVVATGWGIFWCQLGKRSDVASMLQRFKETTSEKFPTLLHAHIVRIASCAGWCVQALAWRNSQTPKKSADPLRCIGELEHFELRTHTLHIIC